MLQWRGRREGRKYLQQVGIVSVGSTSKEREDKTMNKHTFI